MAITHPPYLSSEEHRAPELSDASAPIGDQRPSTSLPGKNYLVQLGASAALWIGAAAAIRSILR